MGLLNVFLGRSKKKLSTGYVRSRVLGSTVARDPLVDRQTL
jgi:hypothetical protein